MKIHTLKISFWKWFTIIRELRKRGKGIKESGAFLLGKIGSNVIQDIVYYDDVDNNSLGLEHIVVRNEGYIKLWKYLEAKELVVLADVHTHPNHWTNQSQMDKEHPIIAQKKHIAIIVPYFAKKKIQFLKGVGIFQYQGGHQWIKIQ